jgi:uncharacterized membrane protein
MHWHLSPRERAALSLMGLTVVSVAFFVVDAITDHSLQFDYLLWNLFLSWIPLIFTLMLLRSLKTRLWSDWLPLGITIAWLLLLPNSFYMISDYLHVQQVAPNELVYDVVMFTAFIITSILLGFVSLYLIHRELRKRLVSRRANSVIAAVLLLCSYAIYLGRDLRWNSWSILTNPAGVLFDVSDHLIHPLESGQMYLVTVSFFVLLGSIYLVGWQLIDAVRSLP